jgi:hypothetical protein
MRTLIPAVFLAILCSACFEDDTLVLPHEQGDREMGVAEMGPFYGSQVYYDLHSNREVVSNTVTSWDLRFESAGGGWNIWLNTSKFMLAGNTGDTVFSSIPVRDRIEMKFDHSGGNPDSTAIGDWYAIDGDLAVSLKQVYLVDRGMDEKSRPQGLTKVRFEISGNDYLIRYADPGAEEGSTILVPRDPGKDWIYFSFDNGIIGIVPDTEEFSLLFTRYTTMLQTDEGEDYPYIVTGVLLNPSGVAAALDTIHDFGLLTLQDTLDLELTTRADVIGYDWKIYDFDAGIYTIIPGYAYVISDRNGFYYKLRFIDFYNDTGERGYPRFEFVRL